VLRILIVDDTQLHLDGLASVLRSQPQVGEVQTAAGPDSAVRRMTSFSPDVILLNTTMGESAAVMRIISQAVEQARIVAIAVNETEDEVLTWAESGVAGYLFRGESLNSLIAVLESVARGEALCPPRVTATLLRRVADLASERQLSTDVRRLTAREREILQLIEQGLSNKDIARRLFIEVRTVKNHVHNILEKLQVSGRGAAAALIRRPVQF
jgi:two-component system nitrate/nitrite response regulator NarL